MNFSESVADFFTPFFQPHLLNVDWLDSRQDAFSVESADNGHILREYTTGRALCAFDFHLTARMAYSSHKISNQENLSFWNRLTQWVQTQSHAGILPVLPGGFIPQGLQILRPGCLSDSQDNGTGIYRLPCRLIYLTEW